MNDIASSKNIGGLVSEAIALSVEQIVELIHVEGKSFSGVREGAGAAELKVFITINVLSLTLPRSIEDTALSYNRICAGLRLRL